MNTLLGASANKNQLFLNAAMANRHGVISGATGTGKTVTLQVLVGSQLGRQIVRGILGSLGLGKK
jgi:uncharacterized protein